MTTSTWKDSLLIGVSSIDHQHKQLIQYFDQLSDAMRGRLSAQILQDTINQLKLYTKSHFSKEEEYMQQMNYPSMAQHIQAHRYFIKRVDEFEKTVSTGNMLVSIEIISFLKDWFMNHIKNTDTQLVPYLKKMGV